VAQPQRAALLGELVLLEVEYRRLAGERPPAEERQLRLIQDIWAKELEP
jgi:hypothetical protein